MHFLGMSDISLIVSEIGGNAKLYVYIGDCTSAMTSREYPTTELLQFCETFFKGKYQICGVSKEKSASGIESAADNKSRAVDG